MGICAICMLRKSTLSYVGQKIVANVQRGNSDLLIHEPGCRMEKGKEGKRKIRSKDQSSFNMKNDIRVLFEPRLLTR